MPDQRTHNHRQIEDTPVGQMNETDPQAPRGFIAAVAVFFLELIKVVFIAGVTIFLVRHFLFKPFTVKGQSMEPTFLGKEYLIIDEITYRFREPVRGEVIVFRSPVDSSDYYLKRIIGLPGERVTIDADTVIIYNDTHPQGIKLEESYITEETTGSATVTLETDQYFVMGDNRDASFDSRRFGPIDREDILGRTYVRGWPIHRVSIFAAPEYNL